MEQPQNEADVVIHVLAESLSVPLDVAGLAFEIYSGLNAKDNPEKAADVAKQIKTPTLDTINQAKARRDALEPTKVAETKNEVTKLNDQIAEETYHYELTRYDDYLKNKTERDHQLLQVYQRIQAGQELTLDHQHLLQNIPVDVIRFRCPNLTEDMYAFDRLKGKGHSDDKRNRAFGDARKTCNQLVTRAEKTLTVGDENPTSQGSILRLNPAQTINGQEVGFVHLRNINVADNPNLPPHTAVPIVGTDATPTRVDRPGTITFDALNPTTAIRLEDNGRVKNFAKDQILLFGETETPPEPAIPNPEPAPTEAPFPPPEAATLTPEERQERLTLQRLTGEGADGTWTQLELAHDALGDPDQNETVIEARNALQTLDLTDPNTPFSTFADRYLTLRAEIAKLPGGEQILTEPRFQEADAVIEARAAKVTQETPAPAETNGAQQT